MRPTILACSVLAAAVLMHPNPLRAQGSDSSASVTFIVVTVNQYYGQQQRRDSGRVEPVPVANATIALKGGPELGVTSDSGRFTVHKVPEGRSEFVFRATGHRPLACKVRVRAGKEHLVDVHLLGDKSVAVWMPFGCKPRG